jgi:hypothetical protein
VRNPLKIKVMCSSETSETDCTFTLRHTSEEWSPSDFTVLHVGAQSIQGTGKIVPVNPIKSYGPMDF